MKRLLLLTIAMALTLAACGGDDGGSTTEPGPDDTESTTPPIPDGAQGEFAIIEVGMSAESQYAVIQNNGDSIASLGGFAICQAPAYHTFQDVEIGPGEFAVVVLGGDEPEIGAAAAAVVTASIGTVSPTDGEIGLYTSTFFGSAEAIVSYVEWGSTGHTRSGVAVEAGIWNDGGFVATSDSTINILATPPGTNSSDWSS